MLGALALFVLWYAIAAQLHIVVLAIGSAIQLKRDRFVGQFRRVEDLLSSGATPPVSIIVPAYNEAEGIGEAIRSMQMLKYPKFEIIVVNDGSTDDTLQRLIDDFGAVPITMPFRTDIETRPVRGAYRARMPIPLTIIDKVNGGKADALNAGTNVAQYPYVLFTDADIVLDDHCVLNAMRHVMEDRVRTVAVGGNIRPANGSRISHGRVVEPLVPPRLVERVQLLEYLRSFVASRPAWSRINSLVLISGALGLFHRDSVAEAGGMATGHVGEDLDLTLRLHRHMRRNKIPYRIVHAPDCVGWTEVPSTSRILRRQRIRWHRGLRRAVVEHGTMLFNPRYRGLGMLAWPSFVLIEFLAPLIEFAGWFVVPIAYLTGNLDLSLALPLIGIAFFVGAINSLISLYLDEAFGYFNRPIEAARLISMTFVENMGWRQRTVWWRVRALVGSSRNPQWGEMPRLGVGNLAGPK
jgi:cellulose synthase/poly-beta-1,6-N-acetylglucosamine synthase-like glycosyltransferase